MIRSVVVWFPAAYDVPAVVIDPFLVFRAGEKNCVKVSVRSAED